MDTRVAEQLKLFQVQLNHGLQHLLVEKNLSPYYQFKCDSCDLCSPTGNAITPNSLLTGGFILHIFVFIQKPNTFFIFF